MSIEDWRYGLSSRVPALQVQSPEFKPQSYPSPQNKKNLVDNFSNRLDQKTKILHLEYKVHVLRHSNRENKIQKSARTCKTSGIPLTYKSWE
jgi:hypothetical protein